MISKSAEPRCDIILPIFNSLTYASECLHSLVANTSPNLANILVIDDCSDLTTKEFLKNFCSKYQNTFYHENPRNLGFITTCNTYMKRSELEFVLLLNSDVIVTPNWLNKLISCADSSHIIGSVNPFTNKASNINLPMIPGSNFIDMNNYLSANSHKHYPDIVTGVGFCMLLRNSALKKIGHFDPIFGQGYCEDSDLCMRLTTNGYRTVIADDTYVFHKGSATFIDRNERYKKNRRIFDNRWKKEYRQQFRLFKKSPKFYQAKSIVSVAYKHKPKTALREAYRAIRDAIKRKESITSLIKTSLRSSLSVATYKQPYLTNGYLDLHVPQKKLSVTYILPKITTAGGVISVTQLVNELILLGVDARIAATYQYPETRDWKLYTEPMIFNTPQDLIQNIPHSDIFVATHWTTAEWVASIQKGSTRKAASVYFLQDYEPWFFPESDTHARDRIKSTYTKIPHKIVKSVWLQSLLKKEGHSSKIIPLGLDLGVFYPRKQFTPERLSIISMARPSTPWRGFHTLSAALEQVAKQHPKLDITLFGEDLPESLTTYKFHNMGIIHSNELIARALSSHAIFIDSSDFQGFGRTALEAMACGCACILTREGGVSAYAEHEKNCLLVPPKDPQAIISAVNRLILDPVLRSKLGECGLQTAKRFSHKREALKTKQHLISLINEQAFEKVHFYNT